MKRLLPFFLLTFLLISCGAPSTPLVTPTATSIPSATSIPTLSSTATPETSPTATKDPNAPQEYTRFENGNYYLDKKTDKGNTLTYTWDVERKSYCRLIFTGYLWDLSPENNNSKIYPFPDQLLLNIYIDHSIQDEMLIPTLLHKNLSLNLKFER